MHISVASTTNQQVLASCIHGYKYQWAKLLQTDNTMERVGFGAGRIPKQTSAWDYTCINYNNIKFSSINHLSIYSVFC